MSVFDDQLSVLNEINTKLGANAGDKAAVLNPTSNTPVPKQEDHFGNKNNDLIRGFKDAINSIPVLARLATAVNGLQPILRELTSLYVAKKLFSKPIGDFFNSKKSNDSAWQSYIAAAANFKGRILPSGEPSQGLSSAEIRDGPEVSRRNKEELKKKGDDWKEAQENLNASREKAVKSFLESTRTVFGDLKIVFGNMGKLFKNIGTNISDNVWPIVRRITMGGIPGGNNGIGQTVGLTEGFEEVGMAGISRLLAIPGIIIGVGAALIKLTKNIAESQRALAGYNGQMAYAFAIHDVKKIIRDIQSAGARAESTKGYLEAWDRLADAFRPIEDQIINDLLEFGTALVNATTAIVNFFKWLDDKLPNLSYLAPSANPTMPLGTEEGEKQAEERRRKIFGSVLDNAFGSVDWAFDNTVNRLLNNGMTPKEARIKAWQDKFGPEAPAIKGALADVDHPWREDPWNKEKWNIKDPQAQEKAKEEDKHNSVTQAMDKIKEAASAAIAYYDKDGAMGAGDFMLEAASWNYDPEHKRPSDHNHDLWNRATTMKRHHGGT